MKKSTLTIKRISNLVVGKEFIIMLFPFYVKIDSMSVKKSFKSRHLVAECINFDRLPYARVTM